MKKSKVRVEELKNSQEVATYKRLRNLQNKFKFDVSYETESIDYVVVRNYVPDFPITLPDGSKFYIEFKGYLRKDDERKMVAVKKAHPDIDIRIVFQKNNRLTGRKMRYSDWAIKYGFEYAIGSVPEEWFRLQNKNGNTSDDARSVRP